MKKNTHSNGLIRKFSKGFFAVLTLNLIAFTVVTTFNSCKSDDSDNIEKKSRTDFISALNTSIPNIGAVPINDQNITNKDHRKNTNNSPTTVFVGFNKKEDVNILDNVNSIKDISDLLFRYDASIQYVETEFNSNYQLQIPMDEVIESLNPLLLDAKKYLYSKGFSESDIQEMVLENNGEETDLIALVVVLTDIEQKNQVASVPFRPFFFQSAFAISAQDITNCALKAIGADVIFSLGSSYGKWTKAAIRKAFRVVASRALGPVGVAIAVVSFSYCLWDN